MVDQNTNTNRGKSLSKAKQALLAKRLQGSLNRMPQTDSIPVHTDTASIPLSFAQERVWFMYQLDPRNPAYNMYNVVRLRGKLDIAILTQSFRTLIQRHQILRTRFVTENSHPVQQLVADIDFHIPVTELQSCPEPEEEGYIQVWIRSEIRSPFNLTQCPLIRVSLLKQNDDDHILVLTIHHIISDEWSNELLWREISVLYQAYSSDQSPTLPDLPVQYSDFTHWQKQRVSKQMETQFAYWREQLDVDLSLLQLPTDRIRPIQEALRGALKWVNFPDELYAKLKALNQAFGTTTFMTLLAAFQVLLYRYTRQTDILVGTPIANRNHPEIKNLIGLFLNTLVMRANFEDNPRFDDFAKQTRQTALDGYAHQDLPFEKLVDGLQPQRDTSYHPIFQVMFVHQKSAFEAIEIPGVTVSQMAVDIGVAKFDLTLFIEEHAQGLRAGLEYNTDLFNSNTADRILGHFQTLLESIVENPQQRVANLQLMPTAERDMLMHQWNHTAIPTPQPPQIQQFFEQCAAQNPEAVATVDDVKQLTYRELDKRANQLARFVRKLGVGANTPVGLLLERSVDMIVAILGVLKAGGAYLPMDPASPPERLAFMLSDAQAPVLLTHKQLAGKIPDHSANEVCIDAEWDRIVREDNTAPDIDSAPENLAYVIYTSGTTGKPKGVPVSHRNLVHSTSARFEFYKKNVDRFLLLSSYSFDSSVAGIFWTLCQGGTLVLPPQGIEMDIPALVATIASHGISHVLTLPSLYAILLEQADAKRLASLNTIIVAGEACRRGLVDLHYSRLPDRSLFNEYGPTECTVWSTAYKIPATFTADRVPIGRPIPNTQNYILDGHGQPMPIGVPGELCIGGAGVTLGYLNRPELTAEKFVEYTIADEAPIRLYRTGDLARYLPNGLVEYLGRIDHQVKIRGYRIEPKEIEAILDGHPAVATSVVIPGKRKNDLQRLYAYIEYNSNLKIGRSALRRFLRTKLPDYMIPAHLIAIDKMPLNANGKIDRDALPPPDRHAVGSDQAYVAPRNQLEKTLSSIWAKRLHVDHVGITDNFFEIGGDSLLALRLIADMKNQTDIDISPADFFRHPSIETIVLQPKNEISIDAGSLIVPIQPKGSKVPVFLFGLPATIFSHFDDDQPIYRFRDYYDELPFPYTRERIENIAHKYISDVTKAFPNGPYILCGYSAGGMIAFEMARQLLDDYQKSVFLFLIEPTVPTRTRLPGNSAASANAHRTYRYTHITSAVAKDPLRGVWLVILKLVDKVRYETRICSYYLMSKLSRVFGYHFPLKWRRAYAGRLHRIITHRYTAQPYSGPVTMCQTQSHFEKFEWSKLFTGDYEYHIIRETNQHSDLFRDKKIIDIWLSNLKYFLDRI